MLFNFLFVITEISLLTSNVIHGKAGFCRSLIPCTHHPRFPTVTWSTVGVSTRTQQNYQGPPPGPFRVWTDTSWEPSEQGDKHPKTDIIQHPASMLYKHSELLSVFTVSDSVSFTGDSRNLAAQDLTLRSLHRQNQKKENSLFTGTARWGWICRQIFLDEEDTQIFTICS